MKRKFFAILTAAVLLLTCGCSLAKPPAADGGRTQSDMLIGVLVTTEHLDLFDFEGWINDNIDSIVKDGDTVIEGDTAQYQGRIYAAQDDEGYYAFPADLEGSLFMCPTITPEDGEPFTNSVVAGAFSDPRTHMIATDAGTALELTGTIYFDPHAVPWETVVDAETELPMNHICFYANPIYQTPEGDVYVTSGSGTSYAADESLGIANLSSSMCLTSKVTETVNGVTSELENRVTVNFEGVKLAEDIIVIEMSADNRQLRAVGYTPAQFPREYAAGSDAAYVIVETHSTVNGEETIRRQVCTVGAEDESFVVFVPEDNGFAAKQTTRVVVES